MGSVSVAVDVFVFQYHAPGLAYADGFVGYIVDIDDDIHGHVVVADVSGIVYINTFGIEDVCVGNSQIGIGGCW